MRKRKSKNLWKSFSANALFYESLKEFLCELCALCVEALRPLVDWKHPVTRARLNLVRS
jgi:hypothetical protein